MFAHTYHLVKIDIISISFSPFKRHFNLELYIQTEIDVFQSYFYYDGQSLNCFATDKCNKSNDQLYNLTSDFKRKINVLVLTKLTNSLTDLGLTKLTLFINLPTTGS